MSDGNEIGQAVKAIRRRRGMKQETVAGLAGLTKGYISLIENGKRRVDSRGLLDRLAHALGCSVLDLTGEPYAPMHRHVADALRTVPDVQLALADCTLDDVPDLPARPLAALREPLRIAHANYMDKARYDLAGLGLGRLLTDLHIHAVTGDSDTRREAMGLLVEGCIVAFGVTKNVGHPDLALTAAGRGYEAALKSGDPALLAFAAQRRGQAFQRVGAVRRAGRELERALAETVDLADPSNSDTRIAEGVGLLHLTAALNAARGGDASAAHDHLQAADELATWTGERNALAQHFGPANLGVWRISVLGVELKEGAAVADAVAPTINVADLASADRVAMLNADSARALALEGGPRDLDAVRMLDAADRAAPSRVRQDPVLRELVSTLDSRAPRRTWELNSLRNRFGLVYNQ
ncbi:helix-turn-helix transcriptional regulator [Amycolatopsis sp. NPDC004079]|uniref:helix-turn-helix domain-containing protein n=1 Tax=Amycolatopsis sp. NPDC004079 TaxID=3154549 RepID=UPI0033B66C19